MRRGQKSKKTPFRKYFPHKRRICRFCERNVRDIDYKKVEILRRYVPERGKITARRVSGTCAFHQKKLTVAIKRARLLALLPYVSD
ncbi:MAG: 30S ribosomal protein S18 [Acidobacteriota bacterium]|nr:30S ribosomal protein S18 [Acidobacteriota bacterium]